MPTKPRPTSVGDAQASSSDQARAPADRPIACIRIASFRGTHRVHATLEVEAEEIPPDGDVQPLAHLSENLASTTRDESDLDLPRGPICLDADAARKNPLGSSHEHQGLRKVEDRDLG